LETRDNPSKLSGRPGSPPGRAVAKVPIVVEALLAHIALRADREAGVADALGNFGVGVRINALRELAVSSRTVTWPTTV